MSSAGIVLIIIATWIIGACLWFAIIAHRDTSPDVHVDWHMTPDEWQQLHSVLLAHSDVPYIAQLLATAIQHN